MGKKYLIVGGVAGGATAAARLRRIDEDAEIIMFERGDYISYANCGLPYYIGNVIKSRDSLFVQTPQSFKRRFNVDVRVKHEVVEINRAEKTVKVKDLAGNSTYAESYDKLIVSPGAEPVRPQIDGISSRSIFTLRSVPDADAVFSYVKENKCRHATVIGAGFIGLEMAENLHSLGMKVTVVEMADQVMSVIDYEMASIIHQHLKSKNVEFYLGDGVTSFSQGDTSSLSVMLKSGRALQTDIVILSIGVRPDSALLKNCGIRLNEKGAVVVDEYLRTSDENIYAIGDAIVFNNPVVNKPLPAYLAGPANKQGRIAANNIVFGNREKYKGSIATAIAKIFDITVASTGLSEKLLKSLGVPYLSSITHSNSHAAYYPGALMMSIKLLYSPDDARVLGAQIVGYDGVDSRINMIASVIGMRGTVYDLRDIEHAYAPPYSSAKDPVNIAGFAAENVVNGSMKIKSWSDVALLQPEEWVILDVRTSEEHSLGAIDSSLNIPLDDLRLRISEVPAGKKILVYCAVGLRGYLAARILSMNGFPEVYNLTGGYKTYSLALQKQSNEDLFKSLCVDESCVAKEVSASEVFTADACGLQCPGPIMKLKSEMEKLADGNVLKIQASDAGFGRDVGAWCEMTGNELLSVREDRGVISAEVRKSSRAASVVSGGRNKTFVVFSDSLDRALASFVMANGACASGQKVTMFFTFWGLNLIKKRSRPRVRKDLLGRMFSMMLPSSSLGVKLSKLNMFGMGTLMMRMRMKSKGVDSLEEMISSALQNGVEFIACQMSMDVMGVSAEELIDGVKIGGVATYLNEAERANLNLFI